MSKPRTAEEAAALAARRKRLGLTCAEAAARLGVSPGTYTRWEALAPKPARVVPQKVTADQRHRHAVRALLRSLNTMDADGNTARPSMDELKELRKLARLSVAELAAAVNVPARVAAAWESGDYTPDPPARRKLIKILEAEENK